MEYTFEIYRVPVAEIPPDWRSWDPQDLDEALSGLARWSVGCSAGLDLSYAIEAGALGDLPMSRKFDRWQSLFIFTAILGGDEIGKLGYKIMAMIEDEGIWLPNDYDQAPELEGCILPELMDQIGQLPPDEAFVIRLS